MYQGGLELQIPSNVLLRVSGDISSGYHFPRRSWRVWRRTKPFWSSQGEPITQSWWTRGCLCEMSWMHSRLKIIQSERDPRRSPVQPSAQSRASYEVNLFLCCSHDERISPFSWSGPLSYQLVPPASHPPYMHGKKHGCSSLAKSWLWNVHRAWEQVNVMYKEDIQIFSISFSVCTTINCSVG